MGMVKFRDKLWKDGNTRVFDGSVLVFNANPGVGRVSSRYGQSGKLPLHQSHIRKASPSRSGNQSREPAAVVDLVTRDRAEISD